jgi:hypothetical protein
MPTKVNAASMRDDAQYVRDFVESLPPRNRHKRLLLELADRLDRAADNKVKRRVYARRHNRELRNGATA